MLLITRQAHAQKEDVRPLDIVFCLDLSGSTNGLVNDVRDNLWLIANELNAMNPKPDFRLGVICFYDQALVKMMDMLKSFQI